MPPPRGKGAAHGAATPPPRPSCSLHCLALPARTEPTADSEPLFPSTEGVGRAGTPPSSPRLLGSPTETLQGSHMANSGVGSAPADTAPKWGERRLPILGTPKQTPRETWGLLGSRGTPGLPSRKGTRDNPGGAPGYGHTRQLGRASLLVWHESRGQVGAGRRLLICWPRLCTQSCCSGACPSHQGHEPTGPRATAAGSPKAGSPGAGSPGVGSPGAGSPPQCAPHSQHWDRPGPPSTE